MLQGVQVTHGASELDLYHFRQHILWRPFLLPIIALVFPQCLTNIVKNKLADFHTHRQPDPHISVIADLHSRPIRPAREKYNVKPDLSCANVSSAGYRQCLFCLCVHKTCILSVA